MDEAQQVGKKNSKSASNKTVNLKKTERFTSGQTIALTIIAVFGFYVGIMAVLGHNRLFHEIEYAPNEILKSMFLSEIRDKFADVRHVDSLQNQDGNTKSVIVEEIIYRNNILSRLDDSSLTQMLVKDQLYVNKESFSNDSLIHYSYKDIAHLSEGGPLFKWHYFIRYSFKYKMPNLCL